MMSNPNWAALRDALLQGYPDLVRRLTERLGSREAAQDALHDTFLRVERGGDLGPIERPNAFLMRMALNRAKNTARSQSRIMSSSDGRAFLEALDEAPGPDRAALARIDVQRLRDALARLPPRRQAIFMASWGEGQSRQQIAETFNIAVRTVQHELTLARQHCAEELGFEGRRVLPLSPRQLSTNDGVLPESPKAVSGSDGAEEA